jgi:hypothetical protein
MSAPSSSSPPSGGSSALKVVLIVLAVMALACAGTCAGCVYLAKQGANIAQQKAKELIDQAQLEMAYQTTRDAVSRDEQVVEKLGEPLNFTTPKRDGTGELKRSGETFQMDVTGPKGAAIVSAIAVAEGSGPFKVTTITVKLTDGTTLDVKPPAEQHDPFDLKIEQ